MAHSHHIKPLWLIQPRLDAGEYRDKLIGSVVKYPSNPTEKRIPYRAGTLPKDMVANLDPKPMQVHNVRFWQRRIHDASVSASLNDIIDFFVERARSDSNENAATVARIWHMDSPGEKFKDLLQNKQYFEELFDLLKGAEDQQAYFVTDVVTLLNLEVADEHGRSNGAGAGFKVPIEEATGLPINVHAGGKFGISREKGMSVTYEGELVVFLGYRAVRLDKVVGTWAKVERVLKWDKHGFTVKDGLDYWPEMVEKPVEGDTDPFLRGAATPKAEDEGKELGGAAEEQEKQQEEHKQVLEAMGFDVAIVG